MSNLNRRLIFRWIATGALWLMLFLLLLISIKSARVAVKSGNIAANALTSKNEQSISEVRDLARAFTVEWATWNGNQDNYTNRLSVFISKSYANIFQPDAVQEVTTSSVISTNQVDSNQYRVKVLLHTRRLIPTEMSNISPFLIPVTKDDLEKLKMNNNYNGNTQSHPMAWVDGLLCVEVYVKTVDDQPTIAGMPVIVNDDGSKGTIDGSDCTQEAPQNVVTFVNQFLNIYYSNQPLNNFIVPNAKVTPVSGGWKLDSVTSVRVNNYKEPTKAYVEVQISAPGIGKLTQALYLKIQPGKGSYLVDDIGSRF